MSTTQTPRQIAESPLVQGAGETIQYQLTTTPWGSSPTSPVVQLFETTGGAYANVSSTNLSGVASIAGDVITLPLVRQLEAGKTYRLEIAFTCGANIFECWADLIAEP